MEKLSVGLALAPYCKHESEEKSSHSVCVVPKRVLGLQEIQGRAFDIITAKDTENFHKKSWMDVKVGVCKSPYRLCCRAICASKPNQ